MKVTIVIEENTHTPKEELPSPHPCFNCGAARWNLCTGDDGTECKNLKYR